MSDFDAFRCKLADAVTIAINSGTMVSQNFGTCPLGCMPGAKVARPYSACAAGLMGLLDDQAVWQFAAGFEYGWDADYSSPYAALGEAYRKRFP